MDDLSWYNYGARFYDAALGRFLSQDRFAEDYFDLTLYQYTANNPILFVDINGDWIDIHDGNGNVYRYDKGKLWQSNPEGDLLEANVSEGSFAYNMMVELNKISASGDAGKELISYFSNDINNVGVRLNNEEKNSYQSGNVLVNPNLKGGLIPTENGMQENPLFISISHELGHAKDNIEDPTQLTEAWESYTNEAGEEYIVYESEKNSTHIENQIRAWHNLPLRTDYTKSIPTRIVTKERRFLGRRRKQGGLSIFHNNFNYKQNAAREKFFKRL